MQIYSVGKESPVTFSLGEYMYKVEKAVEELANTNFSTRLWNKDATLWKDDTSSIELISNSLGWLDVAKEMSTHIDEITNFAAEVKGAGFRSVVLLGMGGSSLAPLVLKETFGDIDGAPYLTVLDSTDPSAVLRVDGDSDPETTLFIIASKSGSTIEPLSLFEYFYELVREIKGESVGENFVAITDPGSGLERLALDRGFRKTFLNPSDIGGRYSALSYFGLVPAALGGIDVAALLESAISMGDECGPSVAASDNPAFYLGAALSVLAREGRDKLSFLISEEFEELGLWLEQLVAESTGKEGVGIIPLAGESLGDVDSYGDDRVFVHIGPPFVEEHHIELLHYLESAGHPVISIRLNSLSAIGGEFLKWEIATAVAGMGLGINPFDQPDVESAKLATKSLLKGSDGGSKLPPGRIFKGEKFRLYLGDETLTRLGLSTSRLRDADSRPDEAVKSLLSYVKKEGSYISILPYFDPEDRSVANFLSALRQMLRNSLALATQLGYGPRYLHSTGQLHKGGPDGGLFLVLYHNRAEGEDPVVPGQAYSFLGLETSQALGDVGALLAKGRNVALFNINTPFTESLEEVYSLLGRSLTAITGK